MKKEKKEELAERIGVSRTAIARYELGEIEPKIKNLIAIAEHLNVSCDYLLGISRKTNPASLEMSENAIIALNEFIKEIKKSNF